MMLHLLQRLAYTVIDIVLPRSSDVAVFDTLDASSLAIRTHANMFHNTVETYAPLRFSSPLVRSCVHAAKYHGHARAARLLGEALAPFVAEILAEKELFGTFETPSIIPVPLHRNRQRERGYNQAELIAQTVAELVSVNALVVKTGVLVRTEQTKPQAQLPRQLRLKNMESAFEIRYPQEIANADIVLIDDVVTTGATMSAARKALLSAGARNVLCVAAAH